MMTLCHHRYFCARYFSIIVVLAVGTAVITPLTTLHHAEMLLCGFVSLLVVNFLVFHHQKSSLCRFAALSVVNFTTDNFDNPHKQLNRW